MYRRIMRMALAILAALLLSGCAQRTVEQMYSLPKRSEEYSNLQSAIDSVMGDMEYSAPMSGENQQTVQMADLNGDGEEEYLVFAKGNTEKPMHILIFSQNADGETRLLEVIESSGSAFEQVEYVDIDGKPGCELIFGRLLSEQVPRSVSVFSFHSGYGEHLMTTGYSKFLTCDLDGNGQNELMVIQHGESDTGRAVAMLYSYQDGAIARSREAELSNQADSVKRIMISKLQDGSPAVYVASAVNESAVITDIFAITNDQFTNISFSLEAGTSVQTLRNYYVYADDIDSDGVLELPSLITMRALNFSWDTQKQYLIRWYALDMQGQEVDKLYSFHNYAGGWYLELDSGWAERVTLDQQENTYIFYAWSESYQEALPVFTVYALTGTDRDTQAVEQNRFILYQAEGVVYAGKLGMASGLYGITEEQLINSFHLIHQDWRTGET